MKAYTIFFDTDGGNSEDWNIFYINSPEVYTCEIRAKAREKYLNKIGKPYGYEALMFECDLFQNTNTQYPQAILEWLHDQILDEEIDLKDLPKEVIESDIIKSALKEVGSDV